MFCTRVKLLGRFLNSSRLVFNSLASHQQQQQQLSFSLHLHRLLFQELLLSHLIFPEPMQLVYSHISLDNKSHNSNNFRHKLSDKLSLLCSCNNLNNSNSSKFKLNLKVSDNKLKFSDHPSPLLKLPLSCSLHLWIKLRLFNHLSCNPGLSDNHLSPTPLTPQRSLQVLISNRGKLSSLQVKLNGSNSQLQNSSNQHKSLSHRRLRAVTTQQASNEQIQKI